MVECRLQRETTYYSLYSSQIAANTLFLCACNSKTPVVLVENDVHLRVIKLIRSLLKEDHDMALRLVILLYSAFSGFTSKKELWQSKTKKSISQLYKLVDEV